MIIDAFPLGYESEVLLIRMRELLGIVDMHVIAEASETLTGIPREPLWPKLAKLPEFAPFVDKVKWGWFDFKSKDPWIRESELRQMVGKVLFGNPWIRDSELRQMVGKVPFGKMDDGDWLIFGDADEIPHPCALEEAIGARSGPVRKLVGVYHQLMLDLRAVGSRDPGYLWEFRQPLVGRVSQFGSRSLSGWREISGNMPTVSGVPAGWHLTCMGGPAAVVSKLRSYAHTEWAHLDEEHVQKCIDTRRDLCDRCNLELVPDAEMPSAVRSDRERFAPMLIGGAQ